MGFTEEFTRLWAAANPPSQRAFAAAAVERARRENIAVTENAFRNRVSDWLNGRLPSKDSDAFAVVIDELVTMAQRKGKLNGLPTQLTDWEALIEAPADVIEDRCPYKGLEAYATADAGDFFGRSEATAEVIRLVSQAAKAGGFVVVAGASGAGKSSLLAAGVIPAAAALDLRLALMFTPGAHPLSSLVGRSGDEPVDDPDRDWRGGAQRWVGTGQGLIVVDQFEEVFTVAEDPDERARFIAALAEIAATSDDGAPAPAVVIIGVRADFIDQLLNVEEFKDALPNRLYFLRAMNADELHEAITEPARKAHLSLEPGLEQMVIRDVCGPDGQSQTEAGALPLLSHALAATWQNRQRNKLTVAGYAKAGGVAGALTTTAEAVLLALTPEEQAAARQIVMRLIHIGDDTRDTRRPRSRLDLLDFPTDRQKAAETAFSALTTARLITIDSDTANLAHEALITGWPRLREWIEEDRAGQLIVQRLERAAEEWEAHHRDSHLLYAGTQLANADAITAGDHSLTRRGSAFLQKSRENQVDQNRRRKNLRRVLVLLTVVALVSAVVAGIFARNASNERDGAQFGQLTAEAQRLTLSDPSLAAQLNLVASNIRPDDEATYTRLLTTENLPLATSLVSKDGAIYTVAVSPDGRTLASSAYGSALRLWDISSPDEPIDLGAQTGHDSYVTSVAFSPDGKTLASTSDDQTVRLWDITDVKNPKQTAQLTGHTGTVFYAAYSPDGKILATASRDKTVRLWDVSNPRQPSAGAVLSGHTDAVRTVAFSSDGHTVASGGDDRTVRLWDVRDADTGAPLGAALTGHTDITHGLAFSPNGRLLASGSDDNTVRLWDLSNRAAPQLLGQPFSGHTGPIWSISFSSDGALLATSSLDASARVFNISNPAKPIQLGQTLAGSPASLYSVTFIKGSRSLATSGADGVIRVWTVPSTLLSGHAGRVIKPSIADERMATGSYNGTLQIWDMSKPATPTLLYSHTDPNGRKLYELALSPDGRFLATTSITDHSVDLFALDANGKPKLLSSFPVATKDQQHVLFSPDSAILAVASDDHSYQLMRLTDPAKPKKLGAPMVHSTSEWATSAAFSPDGHTLVIGGADNELSVWDLSSPAEPRQSERATRAHTGAVNAVAFSPDGKTVASAGDDGTIRLWSISDRKLTPVAAPLTGHGNTVRTLEFTDEGRKLVSAGDSQLVLLWDTSDPANPRQIGGPLSIPGNGRWYATADPSGTFIAAGGDNGALQITILDNDYAATRICRATPNTMSEDLWKEHVPEGISYDPPCGQ